MKEYKLTQKQIADYGRYLRQEERARATIEKYLRDARAFARWLDSRVVSQEAVINWKEYLLSQQYTPTTINAAMAALNGLFRFLNWDCRAKFLKVQRRTFRDASKELVRQDYERLVATARGQGQNRLALLMETICATGIRVSEVKYITVTAARQGRAEISLKGKLREILLPGKLCHKLLKYAGKQKIACGEIFLTASGKGMSRCQIWAEMKRLCSCAGVESSKVFPHNLRRVFATTFYRSCKDIVKLADVLGHSSIETTRIYLLTSGTEHQRQLDRLGLVS